MPRRAGWKKALAARVAEIALILLSLTVVLITGFGPLFGSHGRADTVVQECQMFYGPSGPGEVAQCLAEMQHRSVSSTPLALGHDAYAETN
jgi:hypothetical protein